MAPWIKTSALRGELGWTSSCLVQWLLTSRFSNENWKSQKSRQGQLSQQPPHHLANNVLHKVVSLQPALEPQPSRWALGTNCVSSIVLATRKLRDKSCIIPMRQTLGIYLSLNARQASTEENYYTFLRRSAEAFHICLWQWGDGGVVDVPKPREPPLPRHRSIVLMLSENSNDFITVGGTWNPLAEDRRPSGGLGSSPGSVTWLGEMLRKLLSLLA